MSKKYGVSSTGLITPIIREGDDITQIVCDTVLNAIDNIEDKDIIGITESVIARAEGNYVTVDEVAEDIKNISNNANVIFVDRPIYSRNRFAMILKAIARAAGKKVYIYMPSVDEVGNVVRNHPFTKLNYDEYYKSIVEAEGKECCIFDSMLNKKPDTSGNYPDLKDAYCIDARMYFTINKEKTCHCSLVDICADKCEYGLYGSNKATEEKLKLFPSHKFAQKVVEGIQAYLYGKTGKKVEVMVYGDGCFKDPVGGIWEFADPVVSPAYTSGLEGTPNEIKIKNFADDKYKNLSGDELTNAIRQEIKTKDDNLKGNMASQGTTPRRYVDLLGSLMDLTSGSGDKGTPIVYIKRYFKNFADE